MDADAYSKMFVIEEALWWYRGRRKVCFDLLDRVIGKNKSLDILDVGCGTGYNLVKLADYGRASGVDMSPEALNFCRKRGVENVRLHEAGELPFDDHSQDLLTAFDVIEHIDDDRQALNEFHRVLRPGAGLLIYTPALPWMYNDHDRRVHHKRRYVKSELRSKIVEAGFEIQYISYVNLLILPIVLLARLYFRLRPREHAEMEVPPKPLNMLFTGLVYLESLLLSRTTLPYGMTLVALAKKPG